jgi:hypothetical protein
MELTDSQIECFVKNRLRLPQGKRKDYLEQVDHLIEAFEAKLAEDPVFGVKKFLKTGSLKKGTVLRPRDGYGVDADIAVFLEAADASKYDLAELHTRLRNLLVKIYPTKKPEDFVVQPRTLGITYTDSDLAVDLVPLLPADNACDFGWQPSSEGEPPIKTSVTRQLAFIKARKDADPRFRSLARLAKQWRNYRELDQLRSFAIELILAHLQDVHGPAASLETGIVRFFLYIAQTELRAAITFKEHGKIPVLPTDRVVILDPVNKENNVTKRITDSEADEIVREAKTAWEQLSAARWNDYLGETLEFWKSVFGRSFIISED